MASLGNEEEEPATFKWHFHGEHGNEATAFAHGGGSIVKMEHKTGTTQTCAYF